MAAGLQTLISLDQLHCFKMSEFGTAEPYAWTAFFKIDGDTVQVDLADDGRPGLFLTGVCTFVATPGSHGDLRDRSVGEGDDVPIPAELGEVRLPLTPMRATQRTGLPPDFSAPGTVGVVVALLEENLASDAGAAAGRQAFNRAVEQGINDLIPTFGMNKRTPDPGDIKDLIAKVGNAVHDAIEGAQGVGRNILSFFDGDALIDAHVFTADGDALAATPTQQIDARFQRLQDVPGIGTELVDDYHLTGEIVGIPAGPLTYEAERRSAEFGTPAAANGPAVCLVPQWGVQNIIYRDTGGLVHELWRDAAGKTGTTNLTGAAAGAPPATGTPCSYVDTAAGQEVVVYRGNDRNVHSLYWSTGAPGHDNLTGSVGAPAAAGNPAGYFEAAAATHHVIYRTGDGSLHELYWAGPDPVGHGSIMPAGAPPAAGDPVAYLDATHGTNLVIYRGIDRNIHSLYWSGSGSVGHDELSAVAGTPPAAGDPAAYYTAGDDVHQIAYRTADGSIYELWWVGNAPVSGWSVTGAAPGAPPAASDPAAYYSPGANTKHIIYRSADNHLHELSWVPGTATPGHVDLTVSALARSAVDRPAAYAFQPSDTAHLDTRHVVVYRSTDNEIREIGWTTGNRLIFTG
jgi:hypothetical protein